MNEEKACQSALALVLHRSSSDEATKPTQQRKAGEKHTRPYLDPKATVDVLTYRNTWEKINSGRVVRGHVCKVSAGGFVPADAIILESAQSEVYVQTPQFDGDKSLKIKMAFRDPSFTVQKGMGSGSVEVKGEATGKRDPGGEDKKGSGMIYIPPNDNSGAYALANECKRLAELPLTQQQCQDLNVMKMMGFGEYTSRKSLEQSGWNPELAVGYASSNVESLQLLETTGASLGHNVGVKAMDIDGAQPRENPSRNILDSYRSELSKIECLEPVEDLSKTAINYAGKCVPMDNFVPCHSRLILTEWITILAVFTGQNTKYHLRGGEETRSKLEGDKKREEEKQKLAREEAEHKRAEARRRELSPENMLRTALKLEEGTGIKWSTRFTDVDDDGNCQMHCVWLGLKTLIESNPDLRRSPDEKLSATPEEFREKCFDLMAKDEIYMQELVSTFKTYVEDIDGGVLKTLEDFFTLPDFLRDRILATRKRSLQEAIKPDYAQWARDYIRSARGHRILNGRKVFYPLGVSELRALSRILSVKLHVMTKGSVLSAMGVVVLDEVDPRSVPKRYVQMFGTQLNTRRIVRLINLDENHYKVHLPVSDAMRRQQFDDHQYWGMPIVNEDDLPDL
eukprot:CAMPEP_0114497038 /NCGR_PEP_ID=MMETSP0109-20121206/6096_1 /TAXON_ID=29199 /ORGANISM="Chlorarachnion reptans, Strain CCCM449" /LENGTH=623 /DNA_ID=CAMNT_0001674363 /DNA_START=77 /DNA_END=1948 /DNA_ORIENTATION=+